MKKLFLSLSLFCLLSPFTLFAQRRATQPGTPPPPASFTLTVQANPGNAAIYIDGAQIKGNSLTVKPGNHSIRVSAPGYIDFNTTVNVHGDMTVNANLQPLSYQLSVNAANVKGAQVLLNGNSAGSTPYNSSLQPGNYTVTIQAPGYLPYTESFTLNGPKQINATLQPAMATLQVQIPAANINSELKGNHWSQITVFVDGVPQKGNVVTVNAGRRLIKVVAGGLQSQGYYDFQPGQSCVIEPFMGFNVK